MAVIVICLAMLAVFANVQRSRRDAVEVMAVKSTASPTPEERLLWFHIETFADLFGHDQTRPIPPVI